MLKQLKFYVFLMSKKIWPTLHKLAKQKWFDKNEVKNKLIFMPLRKKTKIFYKSYLCLQKNKKDKN